MAGTNRAKIVRRHPHWIEWATGLLSAALVATLIGVILYHAVTAVDASADLAVTITAQRRMPQGFEVSVIISNSGKKAAAAVPITGRLMDGGTLLEEREITIDYVPAQSNVEGALLFAEDPAGHSLDIRASGYRDP